MTEKDARLQTYADAILTGGASKVAALFLGLQQRIEELEAGRIYLGSYTGEFEALKARVTDHEGCIQRLELGAAEPRLLMAEASIARLRGALKSILWYAEGPGGDTQESARMRIIAQICHEKGGV